ncbi:MAG: triose-phosphate isomerase, partial [Oscillospiraceae bacterium]|nr:triose-phosphate isomerase [Oscillospiraceae bacterium]
MYKNCTIKAPFFEIGPKCYLYGDDILDLALAADAASEKYDVDIIFTTPLVELRRVKENTKRLHVFAPHMDSLTPGRGLAEVLPEMLVAAGAEGVMLNHCEKPVSIAQLKASIKRADEVGLATIVCADSIAEASAVAHLKPNIVVAEPTELIGTGKASDEEYVEASTRAVKDVDPEIQVLQGAGIKCYDDVYRNIFAGADATGSSSGIVALPTREARNQMVDDMIRAVREAYDARNK